MVGLVGVTETSDHPGNTPTATTRPLGVTETNIMVYVTPSNRDGSAADENH